jgi:hypothetical protein
MGAVAAPGPRALEAARRPREGRSPREHDPSLRQGVHRAVPQPRREGHGGLRCARLRDAGLHARVLPPARLQGRGASQYQIWLVHPSGRQRYLFGGHSSPPLPEPEEPPEPPEVEPPEEVPPIVDPPPPDLLQTDEPPIDYSRPRP